MKKIYLILKLKLHILNSQSFDPRKLHYFIRRHIVYFLIKEPQHRNLHLLRCCGSLIETFLYDEIFHPMSKVYNVVSCILIQLTTLYTFDIG
jgi:hypothetical protein